MKKSVSILMFAAASVAAYAQNDAQKAAQQAALAITSAPEAAVPVPKAKYWTSQVVSTINFSQLALSNWTAGGYNTVALSANVDGFANYEKGKTTWNNHLQLDYGFFYAKDKPIIQKNKDRIYFESVWGYASPVRNIAYTAQFSFKTQFDNNYNYGTPTDSDFASYSKARDAWKHARKLKSGFLSPAYIDLGIGAKWAAAKWLTINFAPITGGVIIVDEPALRETYGMEVKSGSTPDSEGTYAAEDYESVKFQLGAKLTVDGGVKINDNFQYTTQVVLFSDYLDKPLNLRVNWDNKLSWKLARFFALTFTTNLIYDPVVIIPDLDHAAVQFKEYFEFGFSYTFGPKKI